MIKYLLLAFTLLPFTASAYEPETLKILGKWGSQKVVCIYGYAYYSRVKKIAPLFSSGHPMTCREFKLKYKAEKK